MIAPCVLALLVANPVDQLGFTSAGASLVGAGVARPPGVSAVADNPAAAPSSEHVQAGVGYVAADQHLTLAGETYPVDTARNLQLGLLLPIGITEHVRLALTFAMSLPDERLLRARVLPGDRPRFLMYDNRAQRAFIEGDVAVGFGGDAWDFGAAAGATILSGASGQGVSFVLTENEGYRRADAAVSARLPVVASPTASLYARWREWHAGVMVRGPIEFAVQVGTRAAVQLHALRGEVYTAVDATDFYTPLKGSAGLGWSGEWITVLAAVEWHRWSELPSGVLTLASFHFEGLPVSLPLGTSRAADRLRDVVAPRIGMELTPPPFGPVALVARAGAYFEPTPVEQARLLLDSDRVGGALGVGISSTGPWGVLPAPVSLDVHVRSEVLLPRTVAAAGLVDPRGELRLEGWGISGGATLTLRL